MRPAPKGNQRLHGNRPGDVMFLRDIGYLARPVLGTKIKKRCTTKFDIPVIGRNQTRKRTQKRRFSSAVRSNQANRRLITLSS